MNGIVSFFKLIHDGEKTMDKISDKKNLAKGKFKVKVRRGLHAAPSSEIVKCASSFKSQIYLIYQKQTVNAKSLLSILMLAATNGAHIGIEALGEDAEEAVQSIIHLANNQFHLHYEDEAGDKSGMVTKSSLSIIV
jgi:phosphocarrier protein HPr